MLPALTRKIAQSWDGAQRVIQRIGLARGAQLARGLLGESDVVEGELFTDWQRTTLANLIARMCRDASAELPAPDEVGAVDASVEFISKMPPARQDQLRQLFCLFEAAPLVMGAGGQRKRFSELSGEAQDAAISDWAESSIPQQRAVFQGLKSICMMGYWSQPATWPHIGYSLSDNPGAPERIVDATEETS